MPIFANYTGGISVILGPTGGFLVSFPFAALCISLTKNCLDNNSKILLLLISVIFGILYIYSFDVLWYMLVLNLNFMEAILLLLIYIPGDIIKAIIAVILSSKILHSK